MSFLRMDLQHFAQEKTEKATPKKRQDSRKKGQVPKSTDVNTAIILLAVFLFLWLFGGTLFGDKLLSMLRHTYQTYLLMDVTVTNVETVLYEVTMEASMVMLPLLGIVMVAGIFSSFIQVGALFTTEPLHMKLSKLDPIKGAKRIFSTRALVEFLKSMLKISLTGVAAFSILWFSLEDVMLLSQKSVETGYYEISQLTAMLGIAVAVILLILSIPDYLYQRYDHEKQIRMSKQDVKQEHKNMEGDPKIKSKRKQKQMEMAMHRMMQEVPKADVVITNPTHYAVALRYDEAKMDAPVVIAKGVDYLALKIRGIAEKQEIITVENKPLARALYAQADIGDQVPEDLFKAVAEVLAYVYRLKNQLVK
ncbi:flagellar biosynthesis protein FlhB [Halalkalibacterium ligniniphilum]|uniref:flagellar biosynthesis protein FlhB n=1 Tax=Halalkalibacterium ligniniphilum TaxID=1134413 RepID=UPI0003481CD2|nr:flagellar biosynthesis protein FlhB [Halalkalibacterium ligniniphilum]